MGTSLDLLRLQILLLILFVMEIVSELYNPFFFVKRLMHDLLYNLKLMILNFLNPMPFYELSGIFILSLHFILVQIIK